MSGKEDDEVDLLQSGKKQKDLLEEILGEITTSILLDAEEKGSFTVADIAEKLNKSHEQIRVTVLKLVKRGFLRSSGVKETGYRPANVYELTPEARVFLKFPIESESRAKPTKKEEQDEFMLAKEKEDAAKKEEYSGSLERAEELYLKAADHYIRYAVRMVELMDVEGKGEDPALKVREYSYRAIECLTHAALFSVAEKREETLKKAHDLLDDMQHVLQNIPLFEVMKLESMMLTPKDFLGDYVPDLMNVIIEIERGMGDYMPDLMNAIIEIETDIGDYMPIK